MAQLNQEQVNDMKHTLHDISKGKTDYDVYKDFIIKCKSSDIDIPDKLKSFIVSELKKQQK